MAANSESKPFTVIVGILVILGLTYLAYNFIGARKTHGEAALTTEVTETVTTEETVTAEDGAVVDTTETVEETVAE